MDEIENRLARVSADDLPPIDLAVVSSRVGAARRRRRTGVGVLLVALLAGATLAGRLLVVGPSEQVADSTPTAIAEIRTGTWRLAEPQAVSSASTSFDIIIEHMQPGCGGQFSPHEPVATVTDADIIIAVQGDYTPPEPDVIHTCQGTVWSATVELPEAIGDRALLDAYDDGVRWEPPVEGDPASWVLADPTSVTPESTALDLLVTRIGCSSGVTGEVLRPTVTYTDDAVLVRAQVGPEIDGGLCPGNPQVPYTLNLTEPVGARQLVDEICLHTPESGYAYCADPGTGTPNGGVRWEP